jgi:hypothetical protein
MMDLKYVAIEQGFKINLDKNGRLSILAPIGLTFWVNSSDCGTIFI